MAGKSRWVTDGYLSEDKPLGVGAGLSMAPCPYSGESGLTSNAVFVFRSVCNAFPQITSYGGWSSHGEHASGRAIDIMVSDVALGTAIAEFLRAHSSELHLYDILWRQHIWTPVRARRGLALHVRAAARRRPTTTTTCTSASTDRGRQASSPLGSPSMDPIAPYDDAARERFVAEPPKRVAAPERTPFERDRARVVHAAASRRLAAKTQVVGPQSDDFVRNRLTHSLEVAQVARDLSRALGCEPDIVETAALAHDLGHPPFGHNGERVLAELERRLRRLRGQRPDPPAADPAGGQDLRRRRPLGRAQPDPGHPRRLHEVPLGRSAEAEAPAGVHADGSPRVVAQVRRLRRRPPLFDWVRDGVDGRRRCLEAQVMDLADDVAYSVHDIEDGVVAGRVDLHLLDRGGGVGDRARVVPARRRPTPSSTTPSAA